MLFTSPHCIYGNPAVTALQLTRKTSVQWTRICQTRNYAKRYSNANNLTPNSPYTHAVFGVVEAVDGAEDLRERVRGVAAHQREQHPRREQRGLRAPALLREITAHRTAPEQQHKEAQQMHSRRTRDEPEKSGRSGRKAEPRD